MIEIYALVAELETIDELETIIDNIQKDEPCVVLSRITFPQGNTGHFIGAALDGEYLTTSISKKQHDMIHAVLSYDKPDLDTRTLM